MNNPPSGLRLRPFQAFAQGQPESLAFARDPVLVEGRMQSILSKTLNKDFQFVAGDYLRVQKIRE